MDGDEASFRAFVVARRCALLRTAWLLTGSREDAEDLVQTALAATARHWPRLARSGDPEPYVRRALVNEHVSAWRRRGSRPVVASGVPVPDAVAGPDGVAAQRDPAAASSAVDDRLVLAAALARLTPRQRAVLVLRFYEDLSESQAAAVLGVGLGTVKSQTRHALQRLRELAPELAAYAPPGPGDVPRSAEVHR